MFSRYSVSVENAVEVVELVLEDTGEPTFCLDPERSAVAVSAAEGGSAIAGEGCSLAGNGEAALLIGLSPKQMFTAARYDEGGVDDLSCRQGFAIVVVPHKNAKPHAHLRGRQADAWGGVHSVQHVVNQSLNVVVEVDNERNRGV